MMKQYRIIIFLQGGISLWSRWLTQDNFLDIWKTIVDGKAKGMNETFNFPIGKVEQEDSSPEKCEIFYNSILAYRADSRSSE